MTERIKLADVKRDIEDTFDTLHQYASDNSRDDDMRDTEERRVRVNAFLDQVEADATQLSRAQRVLRMAYRKHHLGVESIGWNELSDELANVLCEMMGDKEFQDWARIRSSHP